MNIIDERSFLSYICGKLLGDGCITRQLHRKPRFQFTHKASDFEWCSYCYTILSQHFPLNPPTYRKLQDIRMSKGYTESYIVQSKTSDLITYLESVWYTNRKKIIPFDFLEKHFDEKSLAWWYLDDGHLKADNNIPRKIILSTDNFSPNENQQMIRFLQSKYSLSFSIDSQNRLLLYDKPQIYYFYRLVEPFLHPSMNRKFINTSLPLETKPPKRTTIYLPIEISLLKPTYEINTMLKSLPHLLKIFTNQEEYIEHYIPHIPRIEKLKNTKPYQISIEQSHWIYINNIKRLTGLNNSQIVTLCFFMTRGMKQEHE